MRVPPPLLLALVALGAREAAADPPPPPDPHATLVTWRILENHGTDPAHFSARLEVIARAPGMAEQRVGPIRLPCTLSTDDNVLTCGYGGAFDYLRVRRVGRVCVVEAQRSTEHGMGPRRALGRFRCTPSVVERVTD